MTSAMKRALKAKGLPVPKPEQRPAPPVVIKTRPSYTPDNGLGAIAIALALAGAADPLTLGSHTARTPTNKSLDWKQQRVLWNREGYCAREACGLRHNNLQNSANDLLYCRHCAFLIQEGPGNKVTFKEIK